MGAKSPAAFRSSSAPIIQQDEIDTYLAIKEGDPVALADRAAITFPDAWKGKSSTPTLAGFSRIDAGFLKGDQQRYFVPCCCCGAFQWLKTEQMKFSFTAEEKAFIGHPNDRTWLIGDFEMRDCAAAIYVCEVCHHGWTDQQRIAAIQSGHPDNPAIIPRGSITALRAHWKATAPFNGIRSRQLNGMYLIIGLKPGFVTYLHQFAQDFLTAKTGGRETLMVWTNIFKAEVFEEASEKVDWKTIMDRAEDYQSELPDQVMYLTCSTDVQQDRVELLVLGWGVGQECWAIDYHVIYGDLDSAETQERVENWILERSYQHSVLGEIKIKTTAIDSGHQTKVHAVYQICGRHRLENFYAVKGSSSAMGSMYQPFKERRYRMNGFTLDTDGYKCRIVDRLKMTTPGNRYIHFPKAKDGPGAPAQWRRFDSGFYQQLCSERRLPEKQKLGGIKWVWKKVAQSARNEVFDLFVYGNFAYDVGRPEFEIEKRWKEVERKLAPADRRLGKVVAIQGKPERSQTNQPADSEKQSQPRALGRSSFDKKPIQFPRGGMFNPLGL